VKIISASDITDLVSNRLGTSADFTESLEGMSEFARHVASFDCPCSERHLVSSLARLLQHRYLDREVRESREHAREQAERLVEGLLDHGDLLEIDDAENDSRLIVLRAPAVCALSNREVILLGIMPFGSDSLPTHYRAKRQLKGYSRILTVEDSAATLNDLHATGYVVVSESEWRQYPEQLNSKLHLAFYTSKFRFDTTVGHVDGLRVLNSDKSVLHYKSRWGDHPHFDGDFIARRQRRYGNEAWAFVRLRQTEPVALLDLPTRAFAFRACDEAWHLQQAIDHELGHPQRYRAITLATDEVILQFFSPIPQWAHRRFMSLGVQVNYPDCLIAYSFPSSGIAAAETKFAQTRMWLAPL
jgi:hypothetical protein